MSDRARGEHQQPYMHSWRLTRPGPPARHNSASIHGTHAAGGRAGPGERGPRARRGRLLAVIILGLLAAGTVGYRARPLPAAPHVSRYPPTPRAWFDAYMAEAVDNPGRVCNVLFAPEFAATYARTRSRSCLTYFTGVSDSAVQITAIRSYKNTAVVRLRQRLEPRYHWGVVLDRVDGGWRAVDLLAGE
jgi:hypothetical protein